MRVSRNINCLTQGETSPQHSLNQGSKPNAGSFSLNHWAALARMALGSLFLAGLLGVCVQADEAERQMPSFFQAGTSLNVQISVLPGGGTLAHSIEEKLPVGWVPSQITLGGVWNPENRAIRWGPFLDNSFRLLT